MLVCHGPHLLLFSPLNTVIGTIQATAHGRLTILIHALEYVLR